MKIKIKKLIFINLFLIASISSNGQSVFERAIDGLIRTSEYVVKMLDSFNEIDDSLNKIKAKKAANNLFFEMSDLKFSKELLLHELSNDSITINTFRNKIETITRQNYEMDRSYSRGAELYRDLGPEATTTYYQFKTRFIQKSQSLEAIKMELPWTPSNHEAHLIPIESKQKIKSYLEQSITILNKSLTELNEYISSSFE